MGGIAGPSKGTSAIAHSFILFGVTVFGVIVVGVALLDGSFGTFGPNEQFRGDENVCLQ